MIFYIYIYFLGITGSVKRRGVRKIKEYLHILTFFRHYLNDCSTVALWYKGGKSYDGLYSLYQVRDAKIKVLASLKQDTEEERSEWEQLSLTLKVESYLMIYDIN